MTNKRTFGSLVISLDFELVWGVFDKIELDSKKAYFHNTLDAIPEILRLFKKYDVHATWATVGMLFNKDWNEWQNNIPIETPKYLNDNLDAYNYGSKWKFEQYNKYFFASQLINSIKDTPGQEIGTHTYSHYYCKEDGQTPETFKADLEKAKELALKLGIQLKSIVFPRNQITRDYTKICSKLGITNFRSNPESWYWQNPEKSSLFEKLFRTGDAYIGLFDKSYKQSTIHRDEYGTFQKASRMFRPPSSNKHLENLKMRRIKSEIFHAAKHNEVYHLWWHPHNFGDRPEVALFQLEEVLKTYAKAKELYNFQSLTMDELSRLI